MDDQTRQTIKNIVNLVRQRKALSKELEGLDGYKNKIEKVKQYYGRKPKSFKSRRTTAARGAARTIKRRKAK